MSADSCDITYDMLKSIDEHALVLQNNLHKQFVSKPSGTIYPCYN